MSARAQATRHTFELRAGSAVYAVTIEPGLLASLGEIVRGAAPQATNAILIQDDAITSTHGVTAAQALEQSGMRTATCDVHATEANKSLATVQRIYDAMLSAGLERTSIVIALGGGIVCDIAGFAAATFHRGVPIVMAPTTLLAMVDASIGGKNGVNLASAAAGGTYKNMIGTVAQPRGIVIDPCALATLPERHLRCGLAECIKMAMLRDDDMLPMISAALAQVKAGDWAGVSGLIARSARHKAVFIEADEREDAPDGRVLLNLGHTFAHAFELLPPLELMHGEAVAIGLCAALRCARAMQRIDAAHEARWRDVIVQTGLPVRLPAPVPVATLRALMQRDKKVRAGSLRLVLPCRAGGAELVSDVPQDAITAALLEIGGTA